MSRVGEQCLQEARIFATVESNLSVVTAAVEAVGSFLAGKVEGIAMRAALIHWTAIMLFYIALIYDGKACCLVESSLLGLCMGFLVSEQSQTSLFGSFLRAKMT